MQVGSKRSKSGVLKSAVAEEDTGVGNSTDSAGKSSEEAGAASLPP